MRPVTDRYTLDAPLTPAQERKLRHIAKGETRNPGNLTTTYSLINRGLIEAEKIGTFPRAHMIYRVTAKGRAMLEAVPS